MEAITVVVSGRDVLIDADNLPLFQAHKWRINPRGYLRRHGERRNTEVSFHREVLKAPVFSEVDHANGDPLDNRKSNLRLCHRVQNAQNRCPLTGTSKYKGVGWHKGAWRARIQLPDKRHDIGRFSTEAEAALAYDYFASRLFGQFARLNEPAGAILSQDSQDGLRFIFDMIRRKNAA